MASKPSRVGLNIGINQMAIGMFGLGIGPIVATQALDLLSGWRAVFAVVAIPGLVIAALLQWILRPASATAPGTSMALEPAAAGAGSNDGASTLAGDASSTSAAPWRVLLGVRNVRFAAVGMFCWLSTSVLLGAFMPNYLTDHLKLSLDSMGYVLSAGGLGAVVGMIGLAALSDRIGCKPVIVGAGVLLVLTLWALAQAGPDPFILFGLMFTSAVLATGAISVTVGPLTVRSVEPGRAAGATGLVMGVGEVVGGAVMPALAGAAAHVYGIVVIPYLSLGAALLGLAATIYGVREPGRPTVAARPTPAVAAGKS
jgi:MFS family permease